MLILCFYQCKLNIFSFRTGQLKTVTWEHVMNIFQNKQNKWNWYLTNQLFKKILFNKEALPNFEAGKVKFIKSASQVLCGICRVQTSRAAVVLNVSIPDNSWVSAVQDLTLNKIQFKTSDQSCESAFMLQWEDVMVDFSLKPVWFCVNEKLDLSALHELVEAN